MITSKAIRQASLLTLAIALLAGSLTQATNPFSALSTRTKVGIAAASSLLMAASYITPYIVEAIRPVQRVGVVTIEGTMNESSKAVEELQAFFRNPHIKAVVLKINSGGGAVGTAQAIYHVVHELKKTYKKPVVAWIENIAASGAYYAACSADVIVASPSAIVGSVGVIGQIWQLKDVLKRFDVGQETITSGDYKAFSNPFNAMTAEQKAMYQDVCDRTYRRFVSDVQQSRPKLAELPVEEWANGRVFAAEHGLELGMIDLLGSQVTVAQTIKDLTQNKRDIVFIFPAKVPFFAKPFNTQKLAVAAIVDSVWDRLEQKMEQAGSLRIKLIG